jgi:2,5-diamino-6-(ribosylamino)-4(3H)-pyrimidinone 5'-phosphate reductase
MSVDGKITSGESDDLDSDRDWKRIHGVKEGLPQYYQIEETIAFNSLNSGRVMAKIGVNTRTTPPEKDVRLTFVIIDRRPHLDEKGVRYLAQRVGKLYLVTNNPAHPAITMLPALENLAVIYYPHEIDLADLLVQLKEKYNLQHLVIESGGTLNAEFIRQGLVDHVRIVVAPLLVGGQATATLMDGPSLQTEADLVNLKALRLRACQILENSYLQLEYDIINDTLIDPV